jgi:molybdate transport system ATP-binding protein
MKNQGQLASSPATSSALEVRIQKHFSGNHAFQLQVEFTALPGITILFGPSGSGKTTILECIAGLMSPDRGRLMIGERVLFDSQSGVNVPVPDRHVGYVFQDLALFPHLTIRENAEYGLAKLNRSQRVQRVGPVLESFRIRDLADRYPKEISGGERQRVALARAVVTEPGVLLLDEPLGGLDAPVKSSILDDLREWNQSHRIPILYVTHTREEVLALGESAIVVESGRVIARGTPHQVLTAPARETVAQLAGFENVFDAVVEGVHEDRGTMTCGLEGGVVLETPLVRAQIGDRLRVGIRAGDILLSIRRPDGLSARNILVGRLLGLAQRDVIIAAQVDCGAKFEVQMTLAARDSLRLAPGLEVWLVIKTHSCHLMAL